MNSRLFAIVAQTFKETVAQQKRIKRHAFLTKRPSRLREGHGFKEPKLHSIPLTGNPRKANGNREPKPPAT